MKKLAIWMLGCCLTAGVSATPITTDVITVVDESGSMGGEHAWIGGMITDLDAALASAAGGDPFSAQYGLTGFGGGSGHTNGHQHTVGGGEFGTAAEFNTATGSLVLNGYLEDGYDGINTAMNYSTLRANAVTNIILVTDEDRDSYNGSLNYGVMETMLDAGDALLNAVVNANFFCDNGSGQRALGVAFDGTGYVADGSGGFTTCSNAIATWGAGTTINDYVNLAFGTQGAAWDLNLLRVGGLTAQSFTAAFVDVKVQETINQIPEPATIAVLGLGLLGFGAYRRKNA